MEVKAIHRGARISAQKTRLVADQIRGLPVDKALNVLTFSPKKAAGIVKKVVLSAIANAEHNEGADIDGQDQEHLRRQGCIAQAFHRARQGPR